MIDYIKEVALGFDKFVNAVFGGYHRETLSSRMGRVLSRDNTNCGICHWLCQGLNLIDPNHCRDAIKKEFRRDEHEPE